MSCIICKRADLEIINLRNGTAIHERCLKLDLSQSKLLANKKLSDLHVELANASPKYNTFWGSIFGDKDEDSRVTHERRRLTDQINFHKEELDRYIFQENVYQQNYSNEIEQAIRFWPSYPPDEFWKNMREKIKDHYNGRCAQCKKQIKNSGQAHHKIPIRLGGLNEISNLVYLCRSCHATRHSRSFLNDKNNLGKLKTIKDQSKKTIKEYSKMSVLERIDLSISIKKKIHIHYTDIDGEESIRWVAVERRFSEGGGGRRSRKWIEGYCHLRKDKRIFRIDRIRTVEIYGYKGAPIN